MGRAATSLAGLKGLEVDEDDDIDGLAFGFGIDFVGRDVVVEDEADALLDRERAALIDELDGVAVDLEEEAV